jgi:hypothetical protein
MPKKSDDNFDERVLLSTIFDLGQLTETVDRLRVQIEAMARNHGIAVRPAA